MGYKVSQWFDRLYNVIWYVYQIVSGKHFKNLKIFCTKAVSTSRDRPFLSTRTYNYKGDSYM